MSVINQNQIGVVGLAVMGANLARNLASRDLQVAVYNRTQSKTEDLEKTWYQDQQDNPSYQGGLYGYQDLESFVMSLQRPRKVMILVKSGNPVDDVIDQLLEYLEPGDIIIDTGNSNWKDTQRRLSQLSEKQIRFVGCGVSGGEEGALRGPSLMPGGDLEAVQEILPYLQKIAARDFQNQACTTYVGSGAAGHFVKMVHNGIEYSIMQGIAEIYDLLKGCGLSTEVIQKHFKDLNSGLLESFLLEITVDILGTKDGDEYLVDKIKDQAKAKGTGGWTVEAGLEFGAYIPSIAESVFARTGSSRNQRFIINRDEIYTHISLNKLTNFEELLHQTLDGVYLASYLQGLDLIALANQEKNWGIDLNEVIRIWQGGCIIRSRYLEKLPQIWNSTDQEFTQKAAMKMLMNGTNTPTPVISSCYNYLQTIQAQYLPTNLTQAQRDYFGAHTYKRVDQEGDFSGGWS
jgi:6-phosphogluconate dehydrogenase